MRLKPVLLCLAVTLLALPSINGSSQENRPTAQAHSPDYRQPAETEEKGALVTPLIVKTVPAEKSQKEASDDAKEKANKAFYDLLTAFVAVGTLLVLAIQTVVFGWQAHRLKQTIDTMKSVSEQQSLDMRASTAATDKAADAALVSASISEKALEGAETPYLDLSISLNLLPAQYLSGEVGAQAITTNIADYIITNFGRSPAIVLEIYQAHVISRICPDPIGFPPLQTNLRRQLTIGPDKETSKIAISTYKSGIKDFRDWIDGIRFRQDTIWVGVQIRYRDVFGNQFLAGFNLAYNRASMSFYALGGPLHNYRRKLTSDELRIAEERDKYPISTT